MMTTQEILSRLPYSKPFLFVDELLEANENGTKGTFFFNEKLEFYTGHFKGTPVTPGVILVECMAQIGVVCLGVFLLDGEFSKTYAIGLTSVEIEFLKPVFPNEKVTVTSQKKYFRFGKLKCEVAMQNEAGETVCTGTIAGMIANPK